VNFNTATILATQEGVERIQDAISLADDSAEKQNLLLLITRAQE
jgi:hypothetical protein